VLIALLAVLGVDLIVIVMFAAIVIGRRRWLKRQPGEFAGAIRLTSGDIHGISPKWKRGSGRWVRHVLVWNKGPLMFRTEVIGVDEFSGVHHVPADEVKRLGDNPVVAEFVCSTATIDVATTADHDALIMGPWSTRPTAGPPSTTPI
jgi:hypothetical protein